MPFDPQLAEVFPTSHLFATQHPGQDASSHGTLGHRSAVTQRLALKLYELGVDGFLWWSSLHSAWTNATLFQKRALKKLTIEGPITPLSIKMKEFAQAAKTLGVTFKTIR